MTLRFHEGFDWLPSGASNGTINALLQARGYYLRGTSGALGNLLGASLATGRFGYGQRLHISRVTNGNEASILVKPIGAQNSAGGWISAGWNISGANTVYPVVGVYDLVNDTVLCCVQFAPNGIIKAYRGLPVIGGGVFLGSSDVYTFNDGADIDVEVFIKVHSSTGEIEVRINTISVLHLININTQPGSNAYFDSICMGWPSQLPLFVDYYLDDLRYYDTAGSINNTWLGTCRVQTCLTAGAGATTDFSKTGASTNWQAAQNQNVDDSKYVYDPTVGDYDLYTIQPLVNSPTVFGVQVTSFVRQDDATQRFFKNRVSSSGTIADGASFATSQTYTGDNDMFELNPNTGLSFTGAQVNALQIGPYVYA